MSTQETTQSLTEKRQVIYASLIRYAPEAASLRDRVLDRLVLGGLIGSSEENPFRIGQIRANAAVGPTLTGLRVEVIQESLNRLISQDKVGHTQQRKRPAYFLRQGAYEEVKGLVESGKDLFDPVLRSLLENTGHLFPYEQGSAVCRTFLCECFARFGSSIARGFAGEEPNLLRWDSVEAAFEAATTSTNLSQDALVSLKARCFSFLRSQKPRHVGLKFYLTQGFYFAQLLGLTGASFSPLGEHAFSGSVLYLDTNVLLVGLLAPDTGIELFREMVEVSKKIGITLRVTRATINEARRVAADREKALDKLLESLPPEIIGRAYDDFITGFLRARESNPELTPREFLAPFDHLSEILPHMWGIEVDERIEDEMLNGRAFLEVSGTIQDAALRTRRFKKSQTILQHDVAHYAMVMDERKGNILVWLLTRDRSLALAAAKIRGTCEYPFCFSLLGFLQSLSPFVNSDPQAQRFADVFSSLIEEQVFPGDELFSGKELLLLIEMHEDVLSTSPESLAEALDYVKTAVLRGDPYTIENCAKVALGLKTFLASSADERRRVLQEEALRAEREAAEARAAEAASAQQCSALQEEINSKAAENSELSGRNEELEQEILSEKKRDRKRRLRQAISCAVASEFIWAFGGTLSRAIMAAAPDLHTSQQFLRSLLSIGGLLVFLGPSSFFIMKESWDRAKKSSFTIASVLIALASSRLLDNKIWASSWSAILEIVILAVPIALGFFPPSWLGMEGANGQRAGRQTSDLP